MLQSQELRSRPVLKFSLFCFVLFFALSAPPRLIRRAWVYTAENSHGSTTVLCLPLGSLPVPSMSE